MQNESDYEYRIVLELTDGRRIPLWAPNSLEEAREHLQHILDDLGIPKGWIECRPRDTYWSAFCPAQRPREQGVVSEHGRLEERDWQGLVAIQNDTIEALRDAVSFHQKKAKEWLTAYQASRCKCVGDYTRLFVRRPRMRRLIAFLMRL